MDKYVVEHCIGISPPFLERSCTNSFTNTTKHDYIGDRVCSSIYLIQLIPLHANVESFENLHIRGYQENVHKRYNNIEMHLKMDGLKILNFKETRIVTFNCYDTTVLYILSQSKEIIRLFHCSFSGCHTTRKGKLLLHEICLFDKFSFFKIMSEPVFSIDVKVINIKTKSKTCNLHYNWNNVEEKKNLETCYIELLGERYLLDQNMCIFCFKSFSSFNNLSAHVNTMHIYYKSSIKREDEQNVLVIKRINLQHKVGSAFAFRNKPKTTHSDVPKKSFISTLHKNAEFDIRNDYNAEEFRYFLTKRIGEIIDTNERKLNLMKKWNDFIIYKKSVSVLPNEYDLVREFSTMLTDTNDILEILILFYHKGVLAKSDVLRMVDELSLAKK
ncbi:hypothetical protein VCUG_00668 [Vavraia culicis subsp. floridensis]|uniref:C2H2-type domain-containing protein n=1 Tax=Vavraia culicis (isolate floridensis) TaxID=948595 RepID=L2GVX4_VAVCU|nr:uncharacterized protein VCUG_00668 [Vavraia culicis subsp. floridensis]ELA47826.1 hypothetical protein VCUG_00668 [Vavraia culicis subsp. floridensis]